MNDMLTLADVIKIANQIPKLPKVTASPWVARGSMYIMDIDDHIFPPVGFKDWPTKEALEWAARTGARVLINSEDLKEANRRLDEMYAASFENEGGATQ